MILWTLLLVFGNLSEHVLTNFLIPEEITFSKSLYNEHKRAIGLYDVA